MDGIGVDEGDLEPEEARARPLVDQVGAGARKLGHRRVQIAHLVGHMVHSGTSLRQEATHRRVLAERLEQLDAAVTDPDRGGANALIIHRRAVLDPRPEQLRVGREGRVEILDGDSQMMDSSRLHASDAIR